jgi:phage tail P2-like protein
MDINQALLPGNATPLELALALTSRRYEDIPVPIREVWDPRTCPKHFLPFLAHAFSVDLWSKGWPEAKQRAVIARAVWLHRHKGTYDGIAAHLEFVDAKLLSAVAPPAKNYWVPKWSREDREHWLDSLPQVRVYTDIRRGKRGRAFVFGSRNIKTFFTGRFWLKSEAALRMGRRADMTVDAVTVPVAVDAITRQIDRVRLKGKGRFGFFGVGTRRKFWLRSDAAARVVTFSFSNSPAHGIRFPVRSGLEVIDAVPDRVFKHGKAPHGFFWNGAAVRKFYLPPTAARRVYDRIAIQDRTRTPPGRDALSFWGAIRFGIPAHTAELKVSIPGRKSRFVFPGPGKRFFVRADRSKWNETFRAGRISKRRSDVLYIDSKTYRPYRAGTVMLAGGDYRLGQWTRS